jgi:heptose I phosphotransferase
MTERGNAHGLDPALVQLNPRPPARYLRAELAAAWQGQDPFAVLAQMPGEVYRQVKGRRTFRFELGGRSYFAKLHFGVGWPEVLKNLLQGRMPVVDASNELRACVHLARAGIATMQVAAYQAEGRNPARRRSLIVTDELLGHQSLEDLCERWPQQPPPVLEKWRLLQAVAETARRMHAAGVNHRDFYICHLLLAPEAAADGGPSLAIIDLHRAQIRRRIPFRWQVRDLAALYFSSLEIGLTRRDLLRFVRRYSGASLRHSLSRDAALWQAVLRRGKALQRKAARRGKDTALRS